jgi:hypothetical protein
MREEIIKIATDVWGFPNWTEVQVNRFMRFAKIIQEREREECAQIAEKAEPYECADLIRARFKND